MFKVGIIGPESTGKSSLGQYLAKRYGATYVPEYARDYVASLHRPYTYDDVCHIARKQIEQIKAEVSGQWSVVSSRTAKRSDSEAVGQRSARTTKWSNSNVVFFDTELIVTRVWFDYVYGAAPDWLLSAMQQYKMDTYLLTYPDIPWIPDPTRENGSDEMRLQLFHRYEQEIQALDVPYYIIRHTDNSDV
ncbi:MAG: ATP-binding protein [Paludibacteraceae bacterium]|nr:ATP-binding protein [Paludibacteraceae bacterium]